MYQVQQITTDYFQRQTLVLPNGNTTTLTFKYVPQQYGWFIVSLTYGQNFTLEGLRITNSPNMLHQFRNQIPFGLACFSTNDREPMLLQDFFSGASILYILSAAEVQQYTEFLSGQVSA